MKRFGHPSTWLLALCPLVYGLLTSSLLPHEHVEGRTQHTAAPRQTPVAAGPQGHRPPVASPTAPGLPPVGTPPIPTPTRAPAGPRAGLVPRALPLLTPTATAEPTPAESRSTIAGVVFDDVNCNGIRDSGEPGLAGVLVSLPYALRGSISTQTAADGSYALTGLVLYPDDSCYLVHERDPVGYVSTTDNDVEVCPPTGGAAFVNFGDRLAEPEEPVPPGQRVVYLPLVLR